MCQREIMSVGGDKGMSYTKLYFFIGVTILLMDINS